MVAGVEDRGDAAAVDQQSARRVVGVRSA